MLVASEAKASSNPNFCGTPSFWLVIHAREVCNMADVKLLSQENSRLKGPGIVESSRFLSYKHVYPCKTAELQFQSLGLLSVKAKRGSISHIATCKPWGLAYAQKAKSQIVKPSIGKKLNSSGNRTWPLASPKTALAASCCYKQAQL